MKLLKNQKSIIYIFGAQENFIFENFRAENFQFFSI